MVDTVVKGRYPTKLLLRYLCENIQEVERLVILADIREFIKRLAVNEIEHYYVGKLDSKPEKAVGVKYIGNKESVLKLEAYSMAPANPY